MSGRQRKPGNYDGIVAGCDPFDHKITTDGKKSNGASYVFRRFDPMDPTRSNMFVCEYVNRPATPEMFYEDIAKQCVFYGCELLCENNKIGLIRWFENSGFEEYLMDRPTETHTEYSKNRQSEKGIPMSGEAVREAVIGKTESYIYANCGRDYDTDKMGNVFFNTLLKCWLKFNPAKWTDYDEFVGAGLCLLAANRYRPIKKKRTKRNFVKTYRRRR